MTERPFLGGGLWKEEKRIGVGHDKQSFIAGMLTGLNFLIAAVWALVGCSCRRCGRCEWPEPGRSAEGGSLVQAKSRRIIWIDRVLRRMWGLSTHPAGPVDW